MPVHILSGPGGQARGDLPTAFVQHENQKFLGEPQQRVLSQEILSGPDRTSVFGWKVAHANQKAT